MTAPAQSPDPEPRSATGPLLLVAIALAGVLSLPSGAMVFVALLYHAVWIGGHAQRFRSHWSLAGHRLALAAAGGYAGMLLGLAWVQNRVVLDDANYLLVGGWPLDATVGRIRMPDSVIGDGTFGSPPFEGPHIEGVFGCMANFVLWTAALSLVVWLLPRGWCRRATAFTRWLPAAVTLWIAMFGPTVTVSPW